MAEFEDVTLDGKPLHSLRVADLKAALEQRGLAKSGQKNELIKRLKEALMLENLQRTSTPHVSLQPNSQIGEEMSQNSFFRRHRKKMESEGAFSRGQEAEEERCGTEDCDLTDFEKGMIVGARSNGLSVTKTAELLGFSKTAVAKVYKEYPLVLKKS